MKPKFLIYSYLICLLLIITLGCIESWETDNLANIGDKQFSEFITQNNSLVTYHKIEKHTDGLKKIISIKGNITNIGHDVILFTKMNVAFYDKKGNIIDIGSDDSLEIDILYLKQDSTMGFYSEYELTNPFIFEYHRFSKIEKYKISVGTYNFE